MVQTVLPPGFRFHPTDEELVIHYLQRKASGRSLDEGIIGEIEIYKYEPWELPGKAALDTRDREWYFFGMPDNKYSQGLRKSRTTANGYWKATGKDRKICCGSTCVGVKKTLVFYTGRVCDAKRTDWLMHEYRLEGEAASELPDVVLCRVRMKGGLGPRNGEQYGAPVMHEHQEAEASSNCNALLPGLVQEVTETTMEAVKPTFTGDLFEIGCLDSNDAWGGEILVSHRVDLPPGGNLFPADYEEPMEMGQFVHSRSEQVVGAIESFHGLVHPIPLEQGILENLLYQASGEHEGKEDVSVQFLDNLDVEHINDGVDAFIELDDLREDLFTTPLVYGMGELDTGEALSREQAAWFESCSEWSSADLGVLFGPGETYSLANLQGFNDITVVGGHSDKAAYLEYPSTPEVSMRILGDSNLLDYENAVGRWKEDGRSMVLSSAAGMATVKPLERTGEFMLILPQPRAASVLSHLVSDLLGKAPAKPAFAVVLQAESMLLESQVDLEVFILQQTFFNTYSTTSFLRKRMNCLSHPTKSAQSKGSSRDPEKVPNAPICCSAIICFGVATFVLIFGCLSHGLCRQQTVLLPYFNCSLYNDNYSFLSIKYGSSFIIFTVVAII